MMYSLFRTRTIRIYILRQWRRYEKSIYHADYQLYPADHHTRRSGSFQPRRLKEELIIKLSILSRQTDPNADRDYHLDHRMITWMTPKAKYFLLRLPIIARNYTIKHNM